MGVFTDAEPFRNHQNTGPLGAGVVPDGKPLTCVAVVRIFDDPRLGHYRLPRNLWRRSSSRRLARASTNFYSLSINTQSLSSPNSSTGCSFFFIVTKPVPTTSFHDLLKAISCRLLSLCRWQN